MFANNLGNLSQYLTITNNDWDLELWEKAAHPDLEVGFFVASGIWMTINVIVGTFANGVVLLAFFRDLKVRFLVHRLLQKLIFCTKTEPKRTTFSANFGPIKIDLSINTL